jgi:hypothetical protein
MVQIRSDSPRGGDRFESVVLHKEKLHPSHRNTRSTVRTTVVVIALSIVVVATYHVASNPEIASSSSSYSSRTTLLSTSTSSSSLRGESSFQDDQCRFYLAESAIPRSGLGLFTAIDLEPGQQAQSMADICLYVADTPRKTHFETHSWAKDVFFGLFEGNHPRAACEGFATLFNSMPIGVQTSKLELQSTHDNAGLHRHDDAGAGAVSQYYGISSTATRHVNAGRYEMIMVAFFQNAKR